VIRGRSRLWPGFPVGIAWLCFGCLLGVAGATVVTRSPREAAVGRQPPTLPYPAAKVLRQVLADAIRVPCDPVSAQVQVPAPKLASGRPAVVTALGATPGRVVQTGDLLAVVSGVPVVAIVTSVPFYRDLGPGDRGPDVLALERSLVAAGKLRVADESFGGDTAAALDAIHRAGGSATQGLGGRLWLNSTVSVPRGMAVAQVMVGVGQVLDPKTPLMVLAGAGNALSCRTPAEATMSVGQTLTVEGNGDGGPRDAVVRSVGEPDQGTSQREVVLEPADAGEPVSGGSAVIPITVTASPVLTVPVAALWTSADGHFSVRRLRGDGTGDGDVVAVQVGQVAGGHAEVSGAGLAEGQTVALHVPDQGSVPDQESSPVGPVPPARSSPGSP
jgi:hypothetical protein